MLKTIKLRRVITSYLEKLLPIKSPDPFIMQYSHQTLLGGHMQLGVHIKKSSYPSFAWSILTCTRPMTTKHDKVVICHEELPFIKAHDALNT